MLEVDADRIDVILGKVFHGEGAVDAMSLLVCDAQRQIGLMRMDQGIVAAKGVMGMVRPGKKQGSECTLITQGLQKVYSDPCFGG
jgi:hypothetical protein